jgi:hypothetical protein
VTLFLHSTTNIFAHNIYFCALVHKLWEYLPKQIAIPKDEVQQRVFDIPLDLVHVIVSL